MKYLSSDCSISSYYDCKKRGQAIDVERLALQVKLKEVFRLIRGAADSGTLVNMVYGPGYRIDRFKVRRLMFEAELVSTEIEWFDIPNHLGREFSIDAPLTEFHAVISQLITPHRQLITAGKNKISLFLTKNYR